jgi:hypothetical protein
MFTSFVWLKKFDGCCKERTYIEDYSGYLVHIKMINYTIRTSEIAVHP